MPKYGGDVITHRNRADDGRPVMKRLSSEQLLLLSSWVALERNSWLSSRPNLLCSRSLGAFFVSTRNSPQVLASWRTSLASDWRGRREQSYAEGREARLGANHATQFVLARNNLGEVPPLTYRPLEASVDDSKGSRISRGVRPMAFSWLTILTCTSERCQPT